MFLFVNNLYAQSNEHMTFKGIPIDGTLSSFVQKIETEGFSLDEAKDNIAIMNGIFAGENAELFIVSSPKTNTVWKVSVFFPKKTSWYSLKSDYKKYVAAMTEKYGNPSEHFEFFSNPYYEGDGYELQALRHDKCHYISFYETDNGNIAVEINSNERINICYEDKNNVLINRREKNNVIQNDL